MSQGLVKTKRRIGSISSTKKITKAMELVATVKLKRWKDSMENVVSYLNVMKEIMSSCASDVGNTDTLELKHFKDATQNLYIVVTSSLGLCGGYNYNIFKFLNNKINKNDKVLVIGTKGLVRYSHEECEIIDENVDVLERFDYMAVTAIQKQILSEYATGKYKKVILVSTLYKNSLTFVPTEQQILPLENLDKTDVMQDTIFEPNKEEVLALIIPKYISTFLFGRLTESLVCEQASRRNAMDSANDNAEELLEKLQIEYNKARQAAITQEITEVVGGAANA